MSCSATRAQWILDTVKAVRQTLRWESFITAYEVSYACEQCSELWNDHFRSHLETWNQTAKSEEDKLPDWPM